MSRNLLAPTLLVAAIGLPWLILGGNRGASDETVGSGSHVLYNAEYSQSAWASAATNGASSVPGGEIPELEFIPVADFREVFRFDINPQWIASRWQRVAVSTDARQWALYRVPLVTGTNPWDLHGSLTYQFDSRGNLRRIQFAGWSADESQLRQMLINHFHFSEVPSVWVGVLTGRFLGQLTGVAIFRHPEILNQSNGYQRIAIWLEINDTRFRVSLSEEAQHHFNEAGG